MPPKSKASTTNPVAKMSAPAVVPRPNSVKQEKGEGKDEDDRDEEEEEGKDDDEEDESEEPHTPRPPVNESGAISPGTNPPPAPKKKKIQKGVPKEPESSPTPKARKIKKEEPEEDNDGEDDGGNSNESTRDNGSDISSGIVHEDLGGCPEGHDPSRDCRCTCEECPREDNDVDMDEQVRATIERHIQAGTFDGHEALRHVHLGLGPPVHYLGIPLRGYNERARDNDGNVLGDELFNEAEYTIQYTQTWNTPINEVIEDDDNAVAHAAAGAALGQRPCTELVVENPDDENLPLWDQNVSEWNRRCPFDWRGRPQTTGWSWPCNETNCGEEVWPPSPVLRQRHHGDPVDPDDEIEDLDPPLLQDEALTEVPPHEPRILPNDVHPEGNRWVCARHIKMNRLYWNTDKLLKAHLAPTCGQCRHDYQIQYPFGISTCTCRTFLHRWQCRRCLERKIRRVQRDFRQRVTQWYTGDVPIAALPLDENEGPGLSHYHVTPGFKTIRDLVVRNSPCFGPGISRNCGRKRLASNNSVFHCRSCGGVVVERRSTRTSRVSKHEPFAELRFGRGQGRFGRVMIL